MVISQTYRQVKEMDKEEVFLSEKVAEIDFRF